MVLPDSVRQALTSGHLAHLVTLNQDGSPQVTIVWIGLDSDEIVCAHLPNHHKLKSIRFRLEHFGCAHHPRQVISRNSRVGFG